MPVSRGVESKDRGTSADCEKGVIEAFQDSDDRSCGNVSRGVLDALVPLLPGPRLTPAESVTLTRVVESMACPSSGQIEYGKFVNWVFAPPRRLSVEFDTEFAALVQGRGRRIPQIHQRCVTLDSLRDLHTFLRTAHGESLRLKTLNTYHVDALVLEPLALKNMCSYAESVAPMDIKEPEPPHWFVSHVWADLFVDFMRSIEEHAAARGGAHRYWACEFARCHGKPGEDLELGLRRAYFKAIWSAVGVLAVLEASPPPAHQRVWCFMEQGPADHDDGRKLPLQLDVARPADNAAVELVLEGTAAAEEQVSYEILKRSVTSSSTQLDLVQDSQRATVLKHLIARPSAYLEDVKNCGSKNGSNHNNGINGTNGTKSVRTIYGAVIWRKHQEPPKSAKPAATPRPSEATR